jgi:hypothetical protein
MKKNTTFQLKNLININQIIKKTFFLLFLSKGGKFEDLGENKELLKM